MVIFSERNNLMPEKDIQIQEVDISLLNRIWNIFYKREYVSGWVSRIDAFGKAESLLDSFGCTYEYPTSDFVANQNIDKLKEYLIDAKWYEIYDFIERYIALCSNVPERNELQKEFNIVLEQEKSGYRIVKGLVTPVTNPEELVSLKRAMSTKFESVNCHFEKAVALYSKRKNPDYENSVKESISAVEAMCCIITGKDASLNKAIEKLKNNGVHIHPALEKAFISLYAYTCDEKGIRHAGIEFIDTPAEDAKYMLISCSAFVNYLIEKCSKQ